MFNTHLNQNQSQDEEDMKEFVMTNHYKTSVQPRINELIDPRVKELISRELKTYQDHKYGRNRQQLSRQTQQETSIPSAPKDYKR